MVASSFNSICSIELIYREEGRSTGLEPATFGSTIQCSNQLSYDRHKKALQSILKIEDKSLREHVVFRQIVN